MIYKKNGDDRYDAFLLYIKKSKSNGKRRDDNEKLLHNTWKHRAHVVMALPAFLILFFIMYVPMAGLVMAFKNFDYTLGIWKSPWNGIDNFKFLLASKATFVTMTRNTLLYYVVFTALGTFLNVVLAIAIDQFVFKKVAKTMQTIMIIPVFISYAAVQFIVYAFISTDTGIINHAVDANIDFTRRLLTGR